MSKDDPHAIEPPRKHPVRGAARSIIEAVAEALPGAGIATAIGRAAFPSAEDKDRDRWAGDLTDRVNEHNRKLHPTATISGTAAALAEWMARTSSDGLHEPYADLDEVAAALGPDHSLSDIENAAEELSSYGLLDFSRYIGGGAVKPGWRLFAVVDPHEKGWILEQDARTLASIVLDVQDSFSASELEQRSGFERRRFNPAFSRLLTLFDPESVINEIQPNYPATCAYLSGGTRARLRRFVKGE